MKTLKINKGWYRSAGHKYGFTGAGIGINVNLLKEDLKLTIDNKTYILPALKGKEFADKHNSYETRGKVTLAIVGESALEEEIKSWCGIKLVEPKQNELHF